jgi:protein TonB
MALSLALHGAAVVFLLGAGAAGGSTSEGPPVLVELALLAAPSASEADQAADQTAADAAAQPLPPTPEPAAEPVPEREIVLELAPPEVPPPLQVADLAPKELVLELAPPDEPPPLAAAELAPKESPKSQEARPPQAKPTPPKPEPARQAAKQTAANPTASKRPPSQDFGSASGAQQAAAGFLPAPAIVWEGKPRYRHQPAPPVYPQRAIELNQQGEALIRVRLDPNGIAVEIVLHRGSGFDLLDRAALLAVRGWHFLPAVRDGRPVAAWVEIPVRFHLR